MAFFQLGLVKSSTAVRDLMWPFSTLQLTHRRRFSIKMYAINGKICTAAITGQIHSNFHLHESNEF
jgi:hypothetical protein